jgi:bifunctional DNA-binding transcriptional regulator/antitoxin component of YhaV-PrlF toxin-antitoxin module
MPKTKVRPDGQVKIPVALIRRYDLQEGDVLIVRDFGGGIVFIPEKVMHNLQLREALNQYLWDQMEDEAEEDVKAGRVASPFTTVAELIHDLRS